MGQLLVHLLVCSLARTAQVINWLHTACLARALPCANLLTRSHGSLTPLQENVIKTSQNDLLLSPSGMTNRPENPLMAQSSIGLLMTKTWRKTNDKISR